DMQSTQEEASRTLTSTAPATGTSKEESGSDGSESLNGSLSKLVEDRGRRKQVRERHHGPALSWSLQEQRMQRSPVNLGDIGRLSESFHERMDVTQKEYLADGLRTRAGSEQCDVIGRLVGS
ncbi:unnamed protein product, partial [Symbiodinium necroappetens]